LNKHDDIITNDSICETWRNTAYFVYYNGLPVSTELKL
jgi:hypothetical protein